LRVLWANQPSHPFPHSPLRSQDTVRNKVKKRHIAKRPMLEKQRRALPPRADLVPLPQRYRTNSPYPKATVLSDLIDKFDVIHHGTLAMFSSHASHVRSIGRCLSWQGLQGIAAIKPIRKDTQLHSLPISTPVFCATAPGTRYFYVS
jgi:hypothetical protein